ncbi:MAG: DUF3040 domain-containing protein, partial [Acidimicrobiia bacterium]|nr:DUF3040 domain-containing protein [Acidimicrobiia bacterium]
MRFARPGWSNARLRGAKIPLWSSSGHRYTGHPTTGGRYPMGLNEREQRILDEIERQFYEDDP